MSGIYLVTTPIGNHSDLSEHARQVLTNTELIFCEDTRVFKSLARMISLDYSSKRIESFHDHSSEARLDSILEQAKEQDICFVSDAGSPIVSDPAYPLVTRALELGVEVKSISGICSPIVALELSGLPPIPFHFHGFFARDKGKKNKDFEMVAEVYGTHIFFEGVSRVIQTTKDIAALYPDFDMVLARELTKEYESVYRFKGREFEDVIPQIVQKGEFILLINNPVKDNVKMDGDLKKIAQEIIDKGAKPKLLSKLLAGITGANAKDIYNELNQSK
jgi:16S rRNA (cytidine1402-2'-O)-methyltransferase